VALLHRLGGVSTGIIALVARGVDRDFLAFLLRSERIISAAMAEKTGSRMPRANMKVVYNLQLSIPESESDQRRIASQLKAQLTEVEKAHQAAETQLSDFQLLEARLLKELLPGVGSYPEKKIGDYAETTSGSTPARGNKDYWEPADIPWVKTAEVAFKPIRQTEEGISRKALDECSVKLLPKQTVLIAMYGQGKTRGQSAILEVEATTNQACFAILPNETWIPAFMQLWLKMSYSDLRSMSEDRGGNQANLNGALLKAVEVPAPSKTIQQEIVNKVNAAMADLEAARKAAETQLNEINLLPQKILSTAFEK
jgi:type I restriction enzyme S subunit